MLEQGSGKLMSHPEGKKGDGKEKSKRHEVKQKKVLNSTGRFASEGRIPRPNVDDQDIE